MGAKSWSSVTNSDDDQQQSGQAQDNASVVNAGGDVHLQVTDSGAILGNVSIANTALETSARISAQTQDSLMAAINGVSVVSQGAIDAAAEASKNATSIANGFSSAISSIKKTAVTGDNDYSGIFKYWYFIPISMTAIAIFGRNKG